MAVIINPEMLTIEEWCKRKSLSIDNYKIDEPNKRYIESDFEGLNHVIVENKEVQPEEVIEEVSIEEQPIVEEKDPEPVIEDEVITEVESQSEEIVEEPETEVQPEATPQPEEPRKKTLQEIANEILGVQQDDNA